MTTLADLVLDQHPTEQPGDRVVWSLHLDASMNSARDSLAAWARRNGIDVPNCSRDGLRIVEDVAGKRWVCYRRLLGEPGKRLPYTMPDGTKGSLCEHERLPLLHAPAALVAADKAWSLIP